ncbi:DUF3592 domain-containing protein [Streptomyces odontomachi]|uniref:DUF3592 domain-containing protein n=1 Tax=Streptomyces odontomachi TaxID=2944940 RepID=UPI00210AA5DC|nr:DUF3592 domain-containing protein [Streptomyces sp. ODS25]
MWVAMSLVAGLVVLGAGTHEAMIQRRLRRAGIRARGRVVRHRVHSGKDGPVYFAVVEFVDVQGGRHTFQARSSGVRGLPVGGAVPVRYLPDAPKGARIDLTRRRVGDIAFPLAVGSLFTAIGIWMLATGR